MKTLAPFYQCPLKFPGKVWRARIVACADGDTLTALVDKGWDHFQADLCDVRFASLDTYESRGAFPPEHLALGAKAKAFTASACLGNWCYLLTAMDPEKYGRILGDPFPLQPDGTLTDVCWVLHTLGLVKPGAYHGPASQPRDIRRYLPEFGA